ncbi:hypothetical protein E2C01_074334 [Portunus trituberculatus]|uniref:Secreted protein n=1 Tax=Portunus trituberculatus TaxID=210409 RepID=A0A5B7IG22_PORTR|nr:hypothetical protein [Portunus trituberculatus]
MKVIITSFVIFAVIGAGEYACGRSFVHFDKFPSETCPEAALGKVVPRPEQSLPLPLTLADHVMGRPCSGDLSRRGYHTVSSLYRPAARVLP